MGVREARAAYAELSAVAVDAVPAGYKQTDVGVIPESWGVVQLGDLFEITSSKRVFQSEWKKEGVPFYRARELAVLSDDGNVDNELFITKSMYEAFRQRHGVPRVGDMLITGVGTLGKVYVVVDEHEFYFKDGNIIWLKSTARANSAFVEQLFLMPVVIRQIEEGSAGTTVGTYTISGAKKTIIPFPAKAEQQAIAEALSDADALIESLQQLIAKKRQIKQGAMQALLTGQQRLPGFTAEWETTSLGDIADRIVGGGTPSRSMADYWGGKIPWMTVKDFACHSKFGTIEYITATGLERSASHLIPKGTLITSTRMGLGKAVIFEVDVSINQDLKAIFLRKDISAEFVCDWFILNESRIAELGSGSTVMGLSLSDLKRMAFHKPSLAEQEAVTKVLSDMDAELTALESRLEKTREIKQGMMQALLTGAIRLPLDKAA